MLTCRELAHGHASDFIDGKLSWRARLGVWYHLFICDNCRRFVAQMRKVRVFLRKQPNFSNNTTAEQMAQKVVEQNTTEQQLAERLLNVYEKQKKSQPPL